MQSAPILLPRRSRLLPVALVVLLHWIVLAVLLDLNPEPLATGAAEHAPLTVLAQLLPREAMPAAAPDPAPAPIPPPVPLALALPSAPPLPEVVLAPVQIAAPDRAGDITSAAPIAPVAASAPPDVASVALAAPAPPAAPDAALPAAPAPPDIRRYAIDMPPPARITLDVARTDADGTEWRGEALLAWQLNDERYRIEVEAGIRIVFARVNLVVLHSEGAVAATGFAPITMTEKRRGRAMTATHFNWGQGEVTFSASQARHALPPGAQDKASIPLQLAAIARGDPRQLTGDIDIFVAEDRDAAIYRFKVVGQEQIDTPLGTLDTWHLTRPPHPGSYKSRLDIWLAPAHGWYPVRIRNTEANGAVTTQTVNNIVLDSSGS